MPTNITFLDTINSRIDKNRTFQEPELNLIGLDLSEIPIEVFTLTHLKKLSLTQNNITEINPLIKELHNLEILGLNYNKISKLPNEIGFLKNLKSIDLWNNDLIELNIVIQELQNLEFLTLGFNKLETIPEELFNFLSNLKALDLQSNPFSEMPIINQVSIFDLMIHFRSKNSSIHVLEVPKALSTPVQQYLTFFPDFVEKAVGIPVKFDVSLVKNGLKIITSDTENLKTNEVEDLLRKYIGLLKYTDTNTITADNIFQLALQTQVSHFHLQFQQKQFELAQKDEKIIELNQMINKLLEIHLEQSKSKNYIQLTQNYNPILNNKTEIILNLNEIPLSNEFKNYLSDLNGNLLNSKDETIDNELLKQINKILENIEALNSAKSQEDVAKSGFWGKIKNISEKIKKISNVVDTDNYKGLISIVEKIIKYSDNLPI